MGHAEVRASVLGSALLAVSVLGESLYPYPWLLMSACIFLMFLSLSREQPELGTEEILGLAVLIWALIAAVFSSPDRYESRQFLTAWLGAWLIFLIVRRLTESDRRLFRSFLGAGAVLLALGIIFEFIGLQVPRAAGLLSNSNLSAALILPVIPLFFSRPGRVLPRVLLMGIAMAGILLSGSRAALLALLLLLLNLLPRGRRSRLLLAGILPVALAGLIWRMSSNPESLAWFRWKIWGAVIRFVAGRPLFGSGAGAISTVMGPYRLPHPVEAGTWGHIIGAAENSFLGLAARIGLPGLLLALCAIGVWIYGLQPLSRWKKAVLLVFATFLLFHDFLEEPAILWWWAAIAALLDHRPAAPDRKKSLLPIMVAFMLGGCLILEPSWAQKLWWRQPASSENAARALRADPWCSPALKWSVEEALRTRPENWDEALAALELSEQECRLRPGVASAWDRQARLRSDIFFRLGAFPELLESARRCIARARKLEPHLPWYPYHLAQIGTSTGNLEAANAALQDALREEKHFTRAWLLLSRNRMNLGDTAGARDALDRAAECRKMLRSGQANSSYHYELLRAPEWQFRQLEDLLQ